MNNMLCETNQRRSRSLFNSCCNTVGFRDQSLLKGGIKLSNLSTNFIYMENYSSIRNRSSYSWNKALHNTKGNKRMRHVTQEKLTCMPRYKLADSLLIARFLTDIASSDDFMQLLRVMHHISMIFWKHGNF